MKLCIISRISGGNDRRKRREKRSIFKLGTINPHTVVNMRHGESKKQKSYVKIKALRQEQKSHGKNVMVHGKNKKAWATVKRFAATAIKATVKAQTSALTIQNTTNRETIKKLVRQCQYYHQC